MDQKKLKKWCVCALGLYILLALLFFWVSGDRLYYRYDQTDMLSGSALVGEITADTEITQSIYVDGGQLRGISFTCGTYGRTNSGHLLIELLSGDRVLARQSVDVSALDDGGTFDVSFAEPLDIPDGKATLRITAPESAAGNAVSLYYGNSVSTARAQIAVELAEDELVRVNGETLDGTLCTSVQTVTKLWFGTYFWYFVAAGFVLVAVCCLYELSRNRQGKGSLVLNMFSAFARYRFLMKQLVSRDFKTKYKRSVLGVFWSFLNPLLTMTVQYIVFSTLFRSSIPNFALYLLSGTVCFSFFNEATTMTLSSIVGNASLITKVYVPKYIYPLTRVMSSLINFLLSLIPLFGVMLVTGTPVRLPILMLPLVIVCLFALSLGVGMFLSSAMVFFRDVQFLWNVFCMLLMYATPVFYPETIIPASFMPIYKCNPLYHVLRFMRLIIMDGISPEPRAYALMIIACFVPLTIGVIVFKKTQDRFVLYI